MNVIEATDQDLYLINQLAHSIWPIAFKDILSEQQINYMLVLMYDINVLQKNFHQNQHRFLLIYDGTIPFGFASYELNYLNTPICKLHKIYLLPIYQKKGAGKMLIDDVKSIATRNNQEYLSLNVNRKNCAVGFYKKYGFVITNMEDIDIGNGYYMNDYVMQLNLLEQFN